MDVHLQLWPHPPDRLSGWELDVVCISQGPGKKLDNLNSLIRGLLTAVCSDCIKLTKDNQND